jgi:hypothetical protein
LYQASKLAMKDKLIPLRLNELLGDTSRASNDFLALTYDRSIAIRIGQWSSRLVLAHLIEQRRESANLARPFGQSIGRLEVFVAARPPETAIWVNDQRMANATAKDSGTVCSSVNHARPRPFFWMSSHVALDFAD